MKQNFIDAYEFDVKQCPFTTLKGKRVRRLEIDHLIPRSIGGADDEKNDPNPMHRTSFLNGTLVGSFLSAVHRNDAVALSSSRLPESADRKT
jgi:hypothetical protein